MGEDVAGRNRWGNIFLFFNIFQFIWGFPQNCYIWWESPGNSKVYDVIMNCDITMMSQYANDVIVAQNHKIGGILGVP